MRHFSMIKLVIAVMLFGIFGIFGCKTDRDDDYPAIAVFNNTTNKEISLASFSSTVKNDIPVVIKPKSKVKVLAPAGLSALDFTFVYDERKYITTTGYVELLDFTVQFSDNEQQGIECLLIVEPPIRKDTRRLLELEEILD